MLTNESTNHYTCPFCDIVHDAQDTTFWDKHKSLHSETFKLGVNNVYMQPAYPNQAIQQQQQQPNVMPEGQGKRTIRAPRHDLIPVEWLDELASIFEEGLPKYGDSWKRGGNKFLTDCLNHASVHLHLYMNGDETENQLAKVAWNCLAVRWHKLRENYNNSIGSSVIHNERTPGK